MVNKKTNKPYIEFIGFSAHDVTGSCHNVCLILKKSMIVIV